MTCIFGTLYLIGAVYTAMWLLNDFVKRSIEWNRVPTEHDLWSAEEKIVLPLALCLFWPILIYIIVMEVDL